MITKTPLKIAITAIILASSQLTLAQNATNNMAPPQAAAPVPQNVPSAPMNNGSNMTNWASSKNIPWHMGKGMENQKMPWNKGFMTSPMGNNGSNWGGNSMPWNSGNGNSWGGNSMPWNNNSMPWGSNNGNGNGNSWGGNSMPWNNNSMPWSNNNRNGNGNNWGGNSMPWNNNSMPWSNNNRNGNGNNWGGNSMPWNSGNGNNWGGNSMPWNNNSMPWSSNNGNGNSWGGNSMPWNNNSMPWNNNNGSLTKGPWNNGAMNKMPWSNNGPQRWLDPNDPKGSFENMWDDAINTPNDMGRMPGGWKAPSISIPNPADVGDTFSKQIRKMPAEMDKMDN